MSKMNRLEMYMHRHGCSLHTHPFSVLRAKLTDDLLRRAWNESRLSAEMAHIADVLPNNKHAYGELPFVVRRYKALIENGYLESR